MVRKQEKKGEVEPLPSRHVFLDTQVYRALGHNPANPAMRLLAKQVAEHRVVLHTTDITLLEVKRQIHERVLLKQQELSSLEKDLRRWRKSAPKSAPSEPVVFEPEALAGELFAQFHEFLVFECSAIVHNALDLHAGLIFKKYFDRAPPFDKEASKEFPDAFMIEALLAWCDEQSEKITVVTGDGAMRRAAEATKSLVAVEKLQDMLMRAAADLGQEGEEAAEAVLNHPAFDQTFREAVDHQMKDVGYVYIGDLPDGEAFDGRLLRIEAIDGWSVVGLSDTRVNLVVDAKLQVQVDVQYDERSEAIYDREDDRYYGAETASMELEDEVDVQILIEVDRGSGVVREAKVLDRDITVSGPHDELY
ncbi:PIN domain-containing protein [Rhizobium rhizogenes]|uniref:PIN domain-containing protein n=1 Tax=Rhizobium rhizogenes TaxID=359 RepID=UPI0015725E44|nr:PIN domain-containing protein [Rhizobium rhizogenes]NTF98210.1 DUF4935 domain-containing protein [Rhizobium rhizogenes]